MYAIRYDNVSIMNTLLPHMHQKPASLGVGRGQWGCIKKMGGVRGRGVVINSTTVIMFDERV